jgi:hypothetical protein
VANPLLVTSLDSRPELREKTCCDPSGRNAIHSVPTFFTIVPSPATERYRPEPTDTNASARPSADAIPVGVADEDNESLVAYVCDHPVPMRALEGRVPELYVRENTRPPAE